MERNPAVPVRRPRATGAANASATALTPKEVLGMLRRHVWLIAFVTILGAVTGIGGWVLIRRYRPLYKAETFIKVLPPVETDPMEIVATQVQQDIQYGHRVSLANLMKRQSMLQELLATDLVQQSKWFRQTVDGDVREALDYLDRNLTAFPHREAEHIIVSMTCGSPKEAARIVDKLAELFVRQHGDTKREEVSEKLAELRERQALVEKEIAYSERAMEAVRNESGLTDLERPDGRYFQHTITMRLNDLELQETELALAIKQLRADIENLQALAEGPISDQIEHAIERDPVVISLVQQQALLEGQLSGQLSKFGANHRVVRQTKQQIEEIDQERRRRQKKVAEQTRRANLYNAKDTLRVLEERQVELQNLRNQAMEEQKKLDTARTLFDQHAKKRDERTEMLTQIKTQIEKLAIMVADPETPKVQILGRAAEPLKMVLSRHILLWGPGGVMLGLILGLALTFVFETLNDLVRTPGDVSRFLHLPLLGVIPDASEDRAVRRVDPCHVVLDAPHSLLGESYRRCRTNLDLTGQDKHKVLLIGSGDPDDGKTSLACNLAEAFAVKHEKVLLIDANLRQPAVHLAFPPTGTRKAPKRSPEGLTAFLLGQCDVDELIVTSHVSGLDLIYAGSPTDNPADLLASRRIDELIAAVVDRYDRIIIDSPPALIVSDVKVLARVADASVLVFNTSMTRKGAAQRTIAELQDVDANIVGCVLFGVRTMKGGYFREEFRAYRRYLKPQLAAAR